MYDGSDICGCETPLERVRYFPRQLITAADMRAEQAFFLNKMRRHNRMLHGWGVTCGLQVTWPGQNATGLNAAGQSAAPTATATTPTQVTVCPGFAVSPQGDDIVVDCPVTFDVATGAQAPDPCTVAWPCPPTGQLASSDNGQTMTLYLAVRAAECQTQPVRLTSPGCGCDATACEYSRIRESFELKVLFEIPRSHTAAAAADAAWAEQLAAWASGNVTDRLRPPMPAPPCPPCSADPWVVIATVTLQQATGAAGLQIQNVTAQGRRVLLSVQALQAYDL